MAIISLDNCSGILDILFYYLGRNIENIQIRSFILWAFYRDFWRGDIDLYFSGLIWCHAWNVDNNLVLSLRKCDGLVEYLLSKRGV